MLGLGEPAQGLLSGQAPRGEQEVGGAAEPVATDQGELEKNVGSVLAEAEVGALAPFDPVPVNPAGRLLERVEEVDERRSRVGDR